jgi:hypothetical protein
MEHNKVDVTVHSNVSHKSCDPQLGPEMSFLRRASSALS